MFILIHGKDSDFGGFDHFTVIASADTVEELIPERAMSGDLIFDAKTLEIVQDKRWLTFDGANSYAAKHIAKKTNLKGAVCINQIDYSWLQLTR